jgi:hypothetical protein
MYLHLYGFCYFIPLNSTLKHITAFVELVHDATIQHYGLQAGESIH